MPVNNPAAMMAGMPSRKEKRAASAEDLDKAEAAQLVWQAKSADNRRQLLQRALELWEGVGDLFWQAETLSLLAFAVPRDEAFGLFLRSAELFSESG